MIYVWAAERTEDREKWDSELSAPLPGHRERDTPDVAAREMEQLRGMIDLPQ